MALSQIQPCAFQPRKDFSAESLQELADSIKEQGVVQPLLVRKQGDHFELIAGERRWRAAELAGLAEVPVMVREADDRTVLELALVENLQRENLNPMEEALGYSQLIDQFQLRQEDIATRVGKSRAAVANALRLLNLAQDLQGYIRTGRLSVGHAKVILALTTADEQRLAAERVLRDSLSVRQTEDLIARLRDLPAPGAKTGPAKPPRPVDAQVAEFENRLQQRFGTKVSLRYKLGKGAVEIRFFNDDDLERILSLLGVKDDL